MRDEGSGEVELLLNRFSFSLQITAYQKELGWPVDVVRPLAEANVHSIAGLGMTAEQV